STPPTTPEHHSLSLHDALPIYREDHRAPSLTSSATWNFPNICAAGTSPSSRAPVNTFRHGRSSGSRSDVSPQSPPRVSVNRGTTDRKSTRLNSSHVKISYAVFC